MFQQVDVFISRKSTRLLVAVTCEYDELTRRLAAPARATVVGANNRTRVRATINREVRAYCGYRYSQQDAGFVKESRKRVLTLLSLCNKSRAQPLRLDLRRCLPLRRATALIVANCILIYNKEMYPYSVHDLVLGVR